MKKKMKSLIVKIKKEPGCEDLPNPVYQTNDASGIDMHAAVLEDIILYRGDFMLVSTGIRMSIPPGYEGPVRPRSGLAYKHGIGVLNAPGTIDADYRGVVGIILFNFDKKPFVIKRGDRIAQLVIARVEQAKIIPVDILDESDRSSGGFGSTGI